MARATPNQVYVPDNAAAILGGGGEYAPTVDERYPTTNDASSDDTAIERIANERKAAREAAKAERERRRREARERARQRLLKLEEERRAAYEKGEMERAARLAAKQDRVAEKAGLPNRAVEKVRPGGEAARAERQLADQGPTPKGTRTRYGRTKQEQQNFQAVVDGAVRSSPDFVPGLDDFLVDAFGFTPDEAAAKTANRFGYTRFYDENQSSINPATGKPYTVADYNNARDAGLNWSLDPEDMHGPIFRKHGTAPGQPLPLMDQRFLANGGDTSGLPEGSFPGPNSDQAVTMLDWIKEIASWARSDTNTLADFQQRLYDAGYYDDVNADYDRPLDPESGKFTIQPAYGTLDSATIEALSTFSDDAAALGFALNKDVYELLDYKAKARAAQRAAASAAGGDGGGGGGGGGATAIPVTDETVVRQLGDTIGQEIFGRRLSAAESQMVADLIRNLETQEGAIREAGGIVPSTDPEAQIRKALRERDPVTAQAHDIAGAFEMFASILGQGMGIGQGGFGQSTLGPTGGAAGVFASPTTGAQ